jgi:hypothetical protein
MDRTESKVRIMLTAIEAPLYDVGVLSERGMPTEVRLFDDKGKNELVAIPASSITEVSYGQDVHRRVGAAIGLAVISLGIGALIRRDTGREKRRDGKKGS